MPQSAQVRKDIRVNLIDLIDGPLDLVRRGRVGVGGELLCRPASEPRVRADLLHLWVGHGCISCAQGSLDDKNSDTHSDTLAWVNLEHAADKVLCIRGQLLGHVELPNLDFSEEVSDVIIVKGQATREEGKEDDAAGPDVRGRAVVRQPSDNFRARVVRAPARRLEHPVVALQRCHPEIGNLDVALPVEEQVLRLEIAVADVEAVAVVDAIDAVEKRAPSVFICEEA